MFYYFIFYSENELNLDNIKKECISEQWMAVASNDKNIIYFTVFSTAVDFLKRNFTKKDMIGLITIPEDEFVNLKEKHRLECFSFPKKLQKIDIEVIELKCDIELQVHQKVS